MIRISRCLVTTVALRLPSGLPPGEVSSTYAKHKWYALSNTLSNGALSNTNNQFPNLTPATNEVPGLPTFLPTRLQIHGFTQPTP